MKNSDQKINATLSILSGVVKKTQRCGLYGSEGVGKTTLAAQFPSPVFLDTEGGSEHLDVARFPRPQSWADVIAIIEYLIHQAHDYKTLIIDTFDWLEKLAAAEVCRRHNKTSIEEFGYGKGFTYLAELITEFLAKLDQLRDLGMHVVLIAHSTIKKFEQPDQSGSYDRYELKLSKTVSPLVKEWLDCLLFITYETKIVETDGKRRAIGGKERVLYTTHTAAWDAKNRHGFADKLPCEFNSIAGAFASSNKQPIKQTSPAKSSLSSRNHAAQPQQLENIQTLWKQLDYGQDEMSKLFQWLGADAIPGVESWNDLNQEQAARAIGFLSKKAENAKEVQS